MLSGADEGLFEICIGRSSCLMLYPCFFEPYTLKYLTDIDR